MGFFVCGATRSPGELRPAVVWEEPRCLLCNSQRNCILLEAADRAPGREGLWFAVTQCQDCGLCFTNPRPDAVSMMQFYPPARERNHPRSARQTAWWNKGRRPFERIARVGQGRLLDVACGSGSFLVRMKERGWQVTGIDASVANAQRLRTKLGLPVVAGSLPHAELGHQSFDVVTIRHGLEKAHQPLDLLRGAQELLVPGGKLMVAVPNIDSLPFKWFGRYWRGLDLPRNLTHFTPDTLHLMLARVGFDVGAARMVRRPAWLQHSAQLASIHEGDTGWRSWLRGRALANLATWYAYLARRCDTVVITASKRAAVPPQAPSFNNGPDRSRQQGPRWHNG
jgi:SAM-dependent methyltransferase